MAASFGSEDFGRDPLNTYYLRKYFKEKETNLWGKKQSESRSLMCVFGSDIYIWNQAENQIVYSNLKNLAAAKKTDSPHPQNEDAENTLIQVSRDLDLAVKAKA